MTGAAASLAILWGACFGSFLGVLVARIPSGRSVVRGRSRCDSCDRPLQAFQLVPVLSWVALCGRCPSCRQSITPAWTLVEVGTAALFLLGTAAAQDLWGAAILGPSLGCLLALSLIDLRIRRLPDAIVVPATSAAFAVIVLGDLMGSSLDVGGALLGAGAYAGALGLIYLLARLIYGREGMGLGDVKTAGFIGLVIGSTDLPSVGVAFAAAILIGGLVGIIAMSRGSGRRATVPFGPMLSAGAVIAVAAGRPLAEAYLGLFR